MDDVRGKPSEDLFRGLIEAVESRENPWGPRRGLRQGLIGAIQAEDPAVESVGKQPVEFLGDERL
jgi:hypothetical protein